MFCPRCGQQCVTDVRFCSRCGLPLNVIAEVTANQGEVVPTGAARLLSTGPPRQKGVRVGTIIMLAAVAMSPLFFGLCFLVDGPAPLLAPLTIFLTGLCFVLYARTFGAELPAPNKLFPYQVQTPQKNPALLLPERPAIEGFAPRSVNTADMAEAPSVTDHTTQLFE